MEFRGTQTKGSLWEGAGAVGGIERFAPAMLCIDRTNGTLWAPSPTRVVR